MSSCRLHLANCCFITTYRATISLGNKSILPAPLSYSPLLVCKYLPYPKKPYPWLRPLAGSCCSASSIMFMLHSHIKHANVGGDGIGHHWNLLSPLCLFSLLQLGLLLMEPTSSSELKYWLHHHSEEHWADTCKEHFSAPVNLVFLSNIV